MVSEYALITKVLVSNNVDVALEFAAGAAVTCLTQRVGCEGAWIVELALAA